jgi:hypothetical protein
VIRSYGKGKAIIYSGNNNALSLYGNEYIIIKDLVLKGAGRKQGNTKNGLSINNCRHISIDSVIVTGFQKAGIGAYRSSDLRITRVHAYENGYAGISVEGLYGTRDDAAHIYIADCFAENNPGDPANLTNHSGNGIVAGYCSNLVIEYCAATNNGWDMPRTGNGPVGIWAYETDSAIIQHCISYRNKTSKGGGDGGGFDLDGGITRSIIQNCLSYENEGSGFGIFQYAGAANWHDNVIRNNISENDGAISPAGAGVFIWNSSRDTAQFRSLLFHSNIIYNTKVAAISYDAESEHTGFSFYDNLFVAKDELVKGRDIIGKDIFTGNNWWSITSGFNIDGIKDFAAWVRKTGKEQLTGINKRPSYSSMNTITDPRSLKKYDFFKKYNYKKVRDR